MKSFLLLILLNQADGSQIEIVAARDLNFAECDRMQRTIWDLSQPALYWEDQGPVPAVDAACVTLEQLSEPN